MEKEIKLGRQRREFMASEIVIEKREAGGSRLSFSLSSETPVERWFGTEVLSHEKGAVRLDRASAGAMPLLFNHNVDDPVGMIDGARLQNGRLMVDAHLFDTPRAQEVGAMLNGGLRNVSVGYQVHAFQEKVKEQLYTAVDWEPIEGSIVTIPADSTVGIGRADDASAKPVRITQTEISVSQPAAVAAINEGKRMDGSQAAAGASAEVKTSHSADEQGVNLSALEMEKERRRAIQSLVKANKLDERIERRWIEEGTPLTLVANQILDVMEERGRVKPQFAAELGMSSNEQQRYSIFRVLRMLSATNQVESQRFTSEAAFEIEASRAVAKQMGREPDGIFVPADILRRRIDPSISARTLAATPGSGGGYLVDTDNVGFIDILRNRSVLSRMGARTLSGLQGNVAIPRQTGGATIAWQAGETATATASDQTFGQLSLVPKTAIAVTQIGRTLMMQSSPSAEGIVMNDLALGTAIGVDKAGIQGTGGAQPIGIISTSGITTGQDAATATYAKILAFQSVAAGSNAILESPGYVTTSSVAGALMGRSRFANTDTPLWDGNILDAEMAGFKAMSSEQMPSGDLLFGSWGEVIIGEWGVLELTMNPYQSFNAGVVGIRAMYTVDVVTRYPQSFVLSTNAS